MKKLVLFGLSFLLLVCKQSTPNQPAQPLFAVYTLQDTTLNSYNAVQISIQDLALSDTPLFTACDLTHYYWKTQAFEFKANCSERFDHFRTSHGSTQGVPFVVTVGTERIYFGTFWWVYSSAVPPTSAIILMSAHTPYELRFINKGPDERSDNRIYASLKQCGVLVE